jgi:hypothetical protein
VSLAGDPIVEHRRVQRSPPPPPTASTKPAAREVG